jgi:hypothetical protein
MTATLVEEDEQDNGTFIPIQGVQIIGQNVSSLHRLKDVNNKGEEGCRTEYENLYGLILRVRWRLLRLRRYFLSQNGNVPHAVQLVRL